MTGMGEWEQPAAWAGVLRAEWTQGASAEKFAKTLQRLWWYQRHVERAVGLTALGPGL